MPDPAPDPAAGKVPPVTSPRRAARATVPGGPATPPPHGVAGGKTPGPETAASGPAVRVRAKSPAGAVTQREGTAPTGSRGLRGAEWRKEAAKASRRRPGKAASGAAAKAPAIPPPPASGASLTASARCLSGCGWTAGPGDPAEIDKAARAHTEKAPKHATNLFSEPVGSAA